MKPFLLAVLLFLAACTPRSSDVPPPPPPPPEEHPPLVPPPPPGPPPVGQAPPPGRPAPPPPAKPMPSRPFDESILSGKEFLLEPPTAVPGPVLRDIRLGPLAAGPQAEAVKTLMAAVSKGGDQPLDPATLEPRWAAYLQGWAKRMNRDGLGGTVRAGVPLPEKDGGVMVPVRVVGDKKEWQGWVFLVKAGAGWLVGDAQVEGRGKDTAPFDPESPQISH